MSAVISMKSGSPALAAIANSSTMPTGPEMLPWICPVASW
jgi:hypothetical protein